METPNEVADKPTAFILPPMSPKNKVPPLQTPGNWISVDMNSLDVIADGLKVTGSGGGIVSIPDVWAHCKVFEQALSEGNHPLHHAAVREWRGLLAVIGLQPNLAYGLSTRIVDLDENDQSLFRRVLARTKPTSVLSPELSWSQVVLVRAHKNTKRALIGMIVPSTIVCPMNSDCVTEVVPWMRAIDRPGVGGEDSPTLRGWRLTDPIKCSALRLEQLAALRDYVSSLHALLTSPGAFKSDARTAVVAELREFKDDLETKLTAELRTSESTIQDLQTQPTNLSLPASELYKTLAKARQVVTGEARSDVVLTSRFPGLVQDALLIDPGILSRSADSGHLRLWDQITLAQYANGFVTLDQLKQRVIGYTVLTPDDLFCDRLVEVTEGGSEARFDAHPLSFKSHLISLTPTALNYFSPAELRKNLRLRQEGDESVVELTITLGGKQELLSRRYKKSGVDSRRTVAKVELPPTLALWPNFRSQQWKLYFIYYGGIPNLQFAPRSLFLRDSGETATLNATNETSEQLAAAKVVARSRTDGDVRYQIFHSQEPPEAIVCALPETVGGLALLLLPEPENGDRVADGIRRTVGIDFGTINTCVYREAGNEPPTPAVFEPRFVYPYPLQKEGRQEIELEFLPATQVTMPFPSITRDREPRLPSLDDRPFWTQFIYYARTWEETLNNVKKGRLNFNLKWSNDPGDRDRVRRFLVQVVVQVGAELVAAGASLGNVTWRFSYPEAFAESQIEHYTNLAARAVSSLGVRVVSEQQGVAGNIDIVPPSEVTAGGSATPLMRTVVGTRPESLAAALFFRSHYPGVMGATAVTIDVGGATSDISVWQNQQEMWRTSVRLGGRDMVQAYLSSKPDLFVATNPSQESNKRLAADLLALKRSSDPAKLGDRDKAMIGLLESEIFKGEFTNRYYEIAGVPQVVQLVRIGELGMAGLAYYVSMVLDHLLKSQILKKESTKLTLCFGGRGSQLLFQSKTSELDKALKTLVHERSGFVANASQIDLCPSPEGMRKHEVAFGLAVDNILGSGTTHYAILGEAVLARGGVDQFSSEQGTDCLISHHAEVEVNDLANLNQFLARYQALFKRKLQSGPQDVLGFVNENLGSQIKKLRESRAAQASNTGDIVINIEPPFILGLRGMIRHIVDKDIRIGST